MITDGTAKFAVRSFKFKDVLVGVLDAIFPVGSIYLTTAEGNPFESFGFGTWELVSQDRCLMGGGAKHPVGENVEAGLPNITGQTYSIISQSSSSNGALSGEEAIPGDVSVATSSGQPIRLRYIKFNASKSNSLYGASDTVQPPAYTVYVYKRIA